jgi:glycosyltransferase involved in cell wall biosynthesis
MITFLDAPILIEPGNEARAVEADLTARLTLRQRRVLVGEANAALLAAGGRAVVLDARIGERRVIEGGGIRFHGDTVGAPVARVVQLPDESFVASATVRERLERRFPVAYDWARAAVIALTRRTRLAPDDGARVRSRIAPAPVERTGAAPAVLVGMHWLDVGGAETWALRTIALVVEAGLVPVVVTDRVSTHPLADHPLLTDAVFVPVAELPERDADEVLRGIVERFALRGVLVHHSHWLYERLAWLVDARPGVPVIDSLHIVEDGPGGFPAVGLREDEWIDTHHVISPALESWFLERGVDPGAVHLAPLAHLTANDAHEFRAVHEDAPFTVAFVGRLARQKRPYLFVRLVRALVAANLPVRAIMHGDGELEATTRRYIRRARLGDIIELRPHTRAVADTWADADLLVVSSLNEGITLTTFEALAAGIPVISADVGSQRTIVSGAALVPPAPRSFVREATRTIVALAASEEARRAVWEDERRRADALAAHEDATSWMGKVIAGWAE